MSIRPRSAVPIIAAILAVTVMLTTGAVTRPAAASTAPSPAVASTPASLVVPVDWNRFTAGGPSDRMSVMARQIMLNSNRYLLQTWYPATYGKQAGEYLDLGGSGEQQIRQPASEALALAISLQTGAYDPTATGVPEQDARRIAIRLISSIAYHHVANTGGGWGHDWQTALWAYFAGSAGWLMWSDLDTTTRTLVANMVVDEADRFLDYEVPYYQDPSGHIVTPGDTKAEENSWNANLLQLATSMMPGHPHWAFWMNKCLELMISSFSRPSDLSNDANVNGRDVRSWLHGSNILEDGALLNHNIVHPDYMATVEQNTSAPLSYALAGMPTPRAALFNASVVYRSLVDQNYDAPPYDAPGGTMYAHGPDGTASPGIYYPQGNDWGTSRRLHFLLLDSQASIFGFDSTASIPAGGWEAEHAATALQMQSRFADGRTYGAASEDTYAGREQWVAVMAGQNYLTHWLAHQQTIEFTNRPYPAALSVAAPPSVVGSAGSATKLTVTSANTGPGTLTHLRFDASIPDGWTADPAGATTWPAVSAGPQPLTPSWTITAPPSTPAGRYVVDVTASYLAQGHTVSRTIPVTVVIAKPPPGGTSWLSDLPWISSANGYGAIHLDQNYYGNPLVLRGTAYPKGIWTNAPSSITYYLGGKCRSFTSDAGIDDAMSTAPRGATVAFQVQLDGKTVYASSVVGKQSPALHVAVDTSGAQQLQILATDGGDGGSYDWADWAGAQLTCSS